jgi:hypothetical protein
LDGRPLALRSDLRFLILPWILFGRYSRRFLMGRMPRYPRGYPAGPSPRPGRLAHNHPKAQNVRSPSLQSGIESFEPSTRTKECSALTAQIHISN